MVAREPGARGSDERHVRREGSLERRQLRGAPSVLRPALRRLLHLRVLELGEQLPDGLEVERVLCRLALERTAQQRDRLPAARRALRGAQLAERPHRRGGEGRRLSADG